MAAAINSMEITVIIPPSMVGSIPEVIDSIRARAMVANDITLRIAVVAPSDLEFWVRAYDFKSSPKALFWMRENV